MRSILYWQKEDGLVERKYPDTLQLKVEIFGFMDFSHAFHEEWRAQRVRLNINSLLDGRGNLVGD